MEAPMSRTILTATSGFTPIIDGVLRDTDLETAIVFGAMWRYCQMKSGECYASLQKIAYRSGLSYKTVQRRVKILVQKGYLQDMTPHLRYSPHTYIDTGKAGIRSKLEAKVDEDGDLVNQDHPHTAYQSRHLEETLENVVDNLDYKGELTPELYKTLENKLNPAPTPKKKTNWNEEIAKLQAGRSKSPPG
jgi:predicted transcriptional regulator